MGNAADTIGETINRKLYEAEDSFKLKLIKPDDRDYLFEVEMYGFLLRATERGNRLWFYVGDTEEQIADAMQHTGDRR